jgi:hypothetical protein
MENIKRIKIDNIDVFLEDMGANKGKITISDTYNHNYSYFWGSMGGTLEDFICNINSGYFADKLMGYKTNYTMEVKKTFAAVRKYIKNEIGLSWFEHLDFQKDMRERLKDFQQVCEEMDSRYFVDNFFNSFVNRLEYWNIEGRFDRERIEKEFKGISEHWYFIVEKPNEEYLWLERFHKKLKRALRKERQIANTF